MLLFCATDTQIIEADNRATNSWHIHLHDDSQSDVQSINDVRIIFPTDAWEDTPGM